MWVDRRSIDLVTLAAVLLGTGSIVASYIGRFSYLPDDGAYAYVADRLLAGAVLNLHIQDVHAGYVNFANASSMLVFGESLLGLRGIVGVLTVVQAGLVYWLLKDRGVAAAIVASAIFATLTLLQFLNPTAHWYCLFLTVVIVALANGRTTFSNRRLLVIGVLLGTVFLFRQLTGVIVGYATMAALLINSDRSLGSEDSKLAKTAWGLAHLALAAYIWPRASLVEWLALGVWPLAIGWHVLRHRPVPLGELARLLAWLGLGGLAAAVPLLVYHLALGSLGHWFNDTFVVAVTMSGFDFMLTQRYRDLIVYAIALAMGEHGFAGYVNLAYWLALGLAPAAAGVLCLKALGAKVGAQPVCVFVIVAPYFALVSLHYQIPIYVYYSLAIVAAATLSATARHGARIRRATVLVWTFCSAVGLYYHAAQPLSRGLEGTFAGKRVRSDTICDTARLGLRLEASACASIEHLVAIVQAHAGDDDSILALPSDADVNFLAARRSPLPFYNSALGITSSAEYAAALESLEADPPALVFYKTSDKYNSTFTNELAEWFRQRYEGLESYDGFEIYRRPAKH